MNYRLRFGFLALSFFLISNVIVYSQSSPITLNVTTAGTLSSLLNGKDDLVKDLILTGNINGSDIFTIKNMALLSTLDLANVNIVSGGIPYYSTNYTKNNTISTSMFLYLTNLTSLILPNSALTIENGAIAGCSKLTSLIIGNGVTVIKSGCFSGCASVTSLTLGESITSIEISAFLGFTGLKNIVIPNSVQTIESQAFRDCKNLASVTFGSGVTSIGSYAFWGCSGLKSIIIPNNVKEFLDHQ